MQNRNDERRFAVEVKPVDKNKWKKVSLGLGLLVVAVLCGTFTQLGIDTTSEPSILGFAAGILVGGSALSNQDLGITVSI